MQPIQIQLSKKQKLFWSIFHWVFEIFIKFWTFKKEKQQS